MSNDQERSSLARQYEAAVRRNRSVPASYSLAPRRPAPQPPVAGPEVRPDETLRAAVEALADRREQEARHFRTAEPVHFRALAEDAERHAGQLRALLATPAPAPGDEGPNCAWCGSRAAGTAETPSRDGRFPSCGDLDHGSHFQADHA